MIFLRLKGGLGNQVFQTLYALSQSKNEEKLVIDCSHFFGSFDADYAGSNFQIKQILKDEYMKNIYFFSLPTYLSKIIWRVLKVCHLINKRHFLSFFDEYFHSVKLFPKSDYKKYFLLQPQSSNIQITPRSVLIHVRKGDYTNSVNSKIYFNCDVEYFKKAAAEISNLVTNPEYFIVTNDRTWVKNNFSFLKNYQLLDVPDAVESFKIMSQFQNFIISNSTFSWWPAFISGSKNVVAPKSWYLDQSQNKDLYPEDWKLI